MNDINTDDGIFTEINLDNGEPDDCFGFPSSSEWGELQSHSSSLNDDEEFTNYISAPGSNFYGSNSYSDSPPFDWENGPLPRTPPNLEGFRGLSERIKEELVRHGPLSPSHPFLERFKGSPSYSSSSIPSSLAFTPRSLSSSLHSLGIPSSLEDLLHQIYRVNAFRKQSTVGESNSSSECSTIGSCPSRPASRALARASQSLRRHLLRSKTIAELALTKAGLSSSLTSFSMTLIKELKKKDKFISKRNRHHDVITAILIALSDKNSQDMRMRFSVEPLAGDSGFSQWRDAMKMCARLPGGIPSEFRRRMWLTLAEQHIRRRNINWKEVERVSFNEWASPDDEGLGDQIVKDLHRTGCSLFCGANAEVNQALLKRVLLGYARWNKSVGYCQGFNMLAAIILEVMDRQESDALKVMIFLIEGVLPESYFANNLRGLSVDMAVFRDLMKTHLPVLSRHLELLQQEAADQATGACYEPPLTNVFTMQWFLTLFSNCLPRDAVMRVWDLTFLQGDEMLLRTALAIWGSLSSRILEVRSADEFYTVMGELTREMLTHGLMDGNQLVKTLIAMAPFPFPGLADLRDKYTYNITPWTQSVSSVAKRGLKLFYLDDEEEEEEKAECDEAHQTLVVAAAFGLVGLFKKSGDTKGTSPVGHFGTSPGAISGRMSPVQSLGTVRPNLDISALKKQYACLRERQRQAHIILTGSQPKTKFESGKFPSNSQKSGSLTMKHLLRGKKALTTKTKKVVRQGVIPHIISNKKQAVKKQNDSTPVIKHKPKHEKAPTRLPSPATVPSSASKPLKASTLKLPALTPKSNQSKEKLRTKPILRVQPKTFSDHSPIKATQSETLHWKDMPRRARRASLPYGVKLMENPPPTPSNLPDIEDGNIGLFMKY